MKYANQLLMVNDKWLISTIELPNKDINETLQLHPSTSSGQVQEIFIELLTNRKEIKNENFIFSTETKPSYTLVDYGDWLHAKTLD